VKPQIEKLLRGLAGGPMLSEEALRCLPELSDASSLRYYVLNWLLRNGTSLSALPDLLQREYLQLLHREEQVLAEWRSIRSALSEISFVPLKGIWLAGLADQKGIAQYLGDIDIWIEPGKLAQAGKALEKVGYAEVNSQHNRLHFHSAYRSKNLGLFVELHSSLSHHDFSRIPSIEIWSRRRSVDGNMSEFSVEDQLVYLFYHAGLHFFDRPSRYLDLVKTLAWADARGWDLKVVAKRSRDWQCQGLFLLAAIACEWITGRVVFTPAFASGETARVRKIFFQLLADLEKGPISRKKYRWALADDTWCRIRGTMHPHRLLGALIE